MKTLATLTIAALLTLTTSVFGQTVAIGHVTAEVIESISASASTVSNFEIAKAATTSETVNLGAITLYSGKDIACNVVLKAANLSDASGNGFTIEPSTSNDSNFAIAQANGSKTIRLNGTTNMNSNQASGQYAGSYTVVFAYN